MSATSVDPDLAGKTATGRRLIAVVYADMVGYSRLISRDDAGTLDRLRALRGAVIDPIISEHAGKILQTGGDSLLITFDSIDNAVRCAVKMQQQIPLYDGDHPPDQRIRFRVGINTGDAIPDGTDLHGDGVNIAARLEASCPPGGICVSRAVRDQVHDRLGLAFQPIGTLTLKNISKPIEAYVLKLDPTFSQSNRSTHRVVRAGLLGLLLIAGGGAGGWYTAELAQPESKRRQHPNLLQRKLTRPPVSVCPMLRDYPLSCCRSRI